ncbi:MAG: PAS domain-containing protein [Verrucomicrobiales bacterium]
MALTSHERITQKTRNPYKAIVLESRAGACSVMIRALEAEGTSVELVRTPDEVGSHWENLDILVVDAVEKDETLRQLVKWARQTGNDPYVVAVGDGEHDPAWLTGGRRGAHASMAEPDEQSARLVLADARGWLAAREPAPAAPQPVTRLPAPRTPPPSAPVRAQLPDWLPPLMDKTSAAMAVFDTQMRYRLCNRAWRDLFGLYETEVNGRSHFEIFPNLGSGWKEAYQRALAGESLAREEDHVLSSSGVALPLRWEISPWRDSGGQPGGVIAIFEPRTTTAPTGGSQHFEAGLGRSVLKSTSGWMVVQDPHGIILGSSKGFSGAVGRQGRMFGRSYWEAAHVLETSLSAEDFRTTMLNWRTGGEFPFPAKITEILQSVDGEKYEIEWSLFPHYRDPTEDIHGIVRIGVPRAVTSEAIKPAKSIGMTAPGPVKKEKEPSPFDAELPAVADWNLPWEEDMPVLLWEVDASGVFRRVGEGLRRFAGLSGSNKSHADAFGSRISLTPAWFQKVSACLRGGLPVDETMSVATDEGPRLVRFIGARAENETLRGWAMTLPAGTSDGAPAADALRLAASEAEKSMLRERLDQLVRALGEARELSPRPTNADDDWNEIGRHLPLAVVVLDAQGDVLAANDALASLIGQSHERGVSFGKWLAEKALASEDDLGRWRSLGWRKQVPCVLRVAGSGGVEKSIELQSRLIGDGRMLVVARDVTDETRATEMLRASEAKFRGFFHEAAIAMVVVNGLGEVVDANESLANLMDRKRREIIGSDLDTLLDGGWAKAQTLEPGRSTLLTTSDGKPVRVARLDRPVANEAANAILVIEESVSATAPALVPYFPPQAPIVESRRLGALRHRVNNDLQVLATLCSIDAGTPGPRTASLQRRLQVASLAYGSTLTASEIEEAVDASAFLGRVANLVSRETGLPSEAIERSLEPVFLPASKFMMLGLAARELLDNALRHGHGPVCLNSGTLGGSAWIEVTDHGPGVAEGFSLNRDAGLGLRIVEMACEDLGGRLTWSCHQSTCFRMVIPATPGGSPEHEA